jgi:Flp pilus assembly pilin Flp
VAGSYIADMQQFEQIVKSPASSRPSRFCVDFLSAPIARREVPTMTFSEWFEFAKAYCRKEEGQTMAEYGVVLAVITIGIAATLVLLSTGINGALTSVIGKL